MKISGVSCLALMILMFTIAGVNALGNNDATAKAADVTEIGIPMLFVPLADNDPRAQIPPSLMDQLRAVETAGL